MHMYEDSGWTEDEPKNMLHKCTYYNAIVGWCYGANKGRKIYTHIHTRSILLCLADGRKGELDPVLDKIYKRMQVIVA